VQQGRLPLSFNSCRSTHAHNVQATPRLFNRSLTHREQGRKHVLADVPAHSIAQLGVQHLTQQSVAQTPLTVPHGIPVDPSRTTCLAPSRVSPAACTVAPLATAIAVRATVAAGLLEGQLLSHPLCKVPDLLLGSLQAQAQPCGGRTTVT
jgi:hypothetical protein